MKKYFLLAFLLLSNSFALFADIDNPCNGTDIDQQCPIDTWIIVFAVIAVVATTLYLHKKQIKALKLAAVTKS